MTVSLAGSVVKLASIAAPFWKVLGLGPAGGPKDLVAFGLYQSRGSGTEEAVKSWLDRVGAAYEVSPSVLLVQIGQRLLICILAMQDHNLGKHVCGSSSGSEGGLVAVEFARLSEYLCEA